MTRPVALFVMGMHRSGTSALTRVLALCGGVLPAALQGANASNPSGYWEPRKSIELNDAILRRHGSNWADPSLRLREDSDFDSPDSTACIAAMRAFLTTLPTAPLVVIKDPRITLLSSMWFEAARQAGFDIAAVLATRHPHEVAASLDVRDRISPELASALWLKYSLLAERNTRTLPRVFVDYANLLEDWPREVKRISAALAIDLSRRDEAAIEGFLQRDLRHQRELGPVVDLFGTDWMSAVYEALGAAAKDRPWEMSTLDRVYTDYGTSEHDFQMVFADFHNHFNFKSLLLRNFLQLSIANKVRACVRVRL